MSLTADQLAERRQYLGGTDMAALAGLNPASWAQPIDVWLDKTGQAQPRPTNKMQALGSLLEGVVADLFAEATGQDVRRVTHPVRDRTRPWLGGHIDRYTKDWSGAYALHSGVLECKWAESKDEWGPTVTDWTQPAKVPARYMVQLQHYLGVTGRGMGYLAVLLSYADFRWYAIAPDYETIGMLRDLGTRFWHENVLTGIPPEPDGSSSYADWLARRWRQDAGTEAVATTAQERWWADYWANERRRAKAELARDAAKQLLQDSMRSTAKLVLPDGQISWRSYDQQETDWQAVARAMAGNDQRLLRRLAKAAHDYTTTSTRRPFRPKRDTEED